MSRIIDHFFLSRFAKEYNESPDRGYGSGVIHVLKKLSSSQLSDVFQPARDQFNGRGSFGNGGAMRAAPFALAFPKLTDVRRVSVLCHAETKTRAHNNNTALLFSSVCPSGCDAHPLLLPGLQRRRAPGASRAPLAGGCPGPAAPVHQQAHRRDGGRGERRDVAQRRQNVRESRSPKARFVALFF